MTGCSLDKVSIRYEFGLTENNILQNNSYFKVHLPDRPSRVICRLYFDTKRPRVLVPVPISKVEAYLSSHKVSFPQVGWIAIALDDPADLKDLGDIMRVTYEHRNAEKSGQPGDRADDDDSTD